MKYATAREAYDLLKKVPYYDFVKGISTDEVSKCCAGGHINRLLSGNPTDYSRENCSAYDPTKPAYALVSLGLVSANDDGEIYEAKSNSLKFLDERIEPKKSLWRQIIDSFK